MTETEFEQIVKDTLNQIRETLIIKGKEYRRNGNPFHNFDEGAKITSMSREKVLDGFMLKHVISVNDIVNDLDKNILPKKSTIDEKIGDILIYMIIKKASLIDKINNYDKSNNS